MPKRDRYLWVCTNERPPDHPKGCCAVSGSRELLEALKTAAVKRGLRERVRVCSSGCMDLCWTGPAVAVMPDHVFYGNVQIRDADEIVDALVRGGIVDRLVVPDELFDVPKTREG